MSSAPEGKPKPERPQLSREEVMKMRKEKAAQKQARKEAAEGTTQDKSAKWGPKGEKKDKQQQGGDAPAAAGGQKEPKPKKAEGPTAPTPSTTAAAAAAASASGDKKRPDSASSSASAPSAASPAPGSSSSSSSSSSAKSKKAAMAAAPSPAMQFDDPKKFAKFAKKQVVDRTRLQKQVALFSHLPQYERETSISQKVGFNSEEIHPAVLRLGLQFAAGRISGANARCAAMMDAFKAWITDYQCPPEQKVRQDIYAKMKHLVRFLIDCRPKAIGTGNAIRYLNNKINQLDERIDLETAKETLLEDIDKFIRERILYADKVIATSGVQRVNNGDVILTYAHSYVVEQILKQAHDAKKKFRVIIVDSRPKLEGKELLQRLSSHGISCTYVLINALSYVMGQVTKVLLGAYGLSANGAVVSRCGTALVSMVAHGCNKPVLVCCETYKFHERVQLDAICDNELGDPDELVTPVGKSSPPLADWRSQAKLKLLNLVYDLTPVEYVTMVITEVGIIPPTSAPVVIREYQKDMMAV